MANFMVLWTESEASGAHAEVDTYFLVRQNSLSINILAESSLATLKLWLKFVIFDWDLYSYMSP